LKQGKKVFLNKYGAPLNVSSFRLDYWERILSALDIRKRKFYATRHTLITEMVDKGIDLKEIAGYCGTSVAMIEQHYCAKSELGPDAIEKQPTQSKHHGKAQEVFEKLAEKSAVLLASPTGFEPVSSLH
jgi:integrase